MKPILFIGSILFAGLAQADTTVSIVFPTATALTGEALLNAISAIDANSTFTAQDPGSAAIDDTTGNGGVLSVTTDINGADILIEFALPVASVSVSFPGLKNVNCPASNCYSDDIIAYNGAAVGLTPAQVQALPGTDILGQSSSTQEPSIATVGGGTQNNIFAIQIESQDVGATDDPTVTQIDNVTYTQVASTASPEPASLILFGAGLAGLALLRRKRARTA